MFSCEFYEIFSRTPPVSASACFKSEFLSAICQTYVNTGVVRTLKTFTMESFATVDNV